MSERKHDSKTSPGFGRGGGQGGPLARGPAQKAKNFKGTLKRLLKYLSPQKYKFLIVIILAVGSTVFSIVGPKISGMATNKISEGVFAQMAYTQKINEAIAQNLPDEAIASLKSEPMPSIDLGYVGQILLIMVGLYVLSSLLFFLTSYIMSDVSQKTVYSMRTDIKKKLDKLPLSYFDARTHGEILSRVTNDMDTIATTLQQSLTQILTSIVTIIGIIIMMLSISPIMTLIALATLPLYAFITMFIAKKSQKFFSGQQKYLGNLNGHVEEMYTGHKIVKVFNHEKQSIEEFEKLNDRLYKVGWKAQFMSGIIFPALNFVSNIGYVVICVVGGLFVAQKRLEIGDVQSFIMYIRSFSQPIIQTANIANIIQSTIASAERVFEVLDEQEEVPEISEPQSVENVSGRVTFKNVSFGYNPETLLIQNMNFEAQSGQTVAIVGPTGAGKTTLVNLLMRFYELNGGHISIDGVDIAKMRRGDLRKFFGMVLQDTWIFNGTIYENIAYGNDNATYEDVVNAAKSVHVDRFIRTLPDGYNTVLNEEASNISQGQKQLLTIARAILAQPTILILDEATSNVDTRTEILIQKAMDKLMKGRTSFVIAHRLSTIKNADSILVMNNGSIIEQGNHNELLAANGFYADLYNSQFSED